MTLWKLVILGVIVGSNNLAVAFGIGALKVRSYWLRIILVFGFFEFVIPLLGVFIGKQFHEFISDYAAHIGGGILIILGGYILIKSLTSKQSTQNLSDKVISWTGLISLALGLSIDNLIVGFSIGLKEVNPLKVASIISICSMLFAFIGLKVGAYLSAIHQKKTEIASSILLILLGLAVLLEWL